MKKTETFVTGRNGNRRFKILVSPEDLEKVKNHSWCVHIRRQGMIKCAQATINYKQVKIHRLILGLTDPKQLVDHIDGNPLNNKRENLRICNAFENQRNRKKERDNTSGFKGVTWSKNAKKWLAQIGCNKQHFYLGLFSNKKKAYAAYCKAALEKHQQFARVK